MYETSFLPLLRSFFLLPMPTHGLRRGLHSSAASRLPTALPGRLSGQPPVACPLFRLRTLKVGDNRHKFTLKSSRNSRNEPLAAAPKERKTAAHPARDDVSREAAKEYSPRRKPWVRGKGRNQPEGAKERPPGGSIRPTSPNFVNFPLHSRPNPNNVYTTL